MSDGELTKQIEGFWQVYPHVDMESFFRRRQIVWGDFQRVYPHADLSKFQEKTVDGSVLLRDY